MSDYRRVLIPVDLAQGRQIMAPAVRRIIDTNDAEITMLHVVEAQPWLGRAGHTLRLMNELEILSYRRFRGARLARRIEWGRPADCILNVLRTDRMDLVLMTAGGAAVGDGARYSDPLGLVAGEVLAESPCPVLLEWPLTAPVNQARVAPVCCALGFDGEETRVLGEAVRAAERCDAPLILVCPVMLAVPRTISLWDAPELGRELDKARARAEELRDLFAPRAEILVEAGHPASVISRAIRLHGAGLLVTGGSRETLLAAESVCPVLYTGSRRGQHSVRQPAESEYEFVARRSA